MYRVNIKLEQELANSMLLGLEKLRQSSPNKDYVISFALTRHHLTGEKCYIPGWHPKKEAPPFTLVETSYGVIALLMDFDEAKQLSDAKLFQMDGYAFIEG